MLLKLAAIWAFISMSTDVSSLLTNVSDPFLQTFQRFAFEDATLLGAPLFPGPLWNDRCTDQLRAMDRLSLIGSQDALILLRASFSAPRVQHLLRCSPLVDNAALTTFDDLLRSTVSLIMTYQTHSGSRHLADQRGLPWRETSCITYTSCLSSFSSEHSITPNHHSVEPSMCI